MDTLILGCGYTGAAVASRLLAAGGRVVLTTRRADPPARLVRAGAAALRVDPADGASLAALSAAAARLAPGARVLCSVPPDEPEPVAPMLRALPGIARVVYLSTTSVYGDAVDVDERTPPQPRSPADRLRLAAEAAVLGGPWSGLVLRPAAIYGPGRGLHVMIRAGAVPPLDPDRPGSRVHVDDLAALCVAGLASDVTGAFPVADEQPATPREVAALCAARGLPEARFAPGVSRFGSRRVDGSAIRRALGLTLRYPTYREGIVAALEAERTGPA